MENKDLYKAVILITMEGTGILVKSSPSLTDIELFDGEFLGDQSIENETEIPTECGLYNCVFEVLVEKPMYNGEGDYDIHIRIKDVEAIEVKELI